MEKQKREYSQTDKRRALAAAYSMLNTKGNHNRYCMTRFGVSLNDLNEGLYFSDVLDCLAIMHNEIAQDEEATCAALEREGVE